MATYSKMSAEQKLKAKARYKIWQQTHKEHIAAYILKRRKEKRPKCRECGKDIPHPASGRKYCSKICSNITTKRNNKKYYLKKAKALSDYKINLGCSVCGYNKNSAALDFHHPDENKERRLSVKSWNTKLGQEEIGKCVLLCANCHREEHDKLREEEKNGDVY